MKARLAAWLERWWARHTGQPHARRDECAGFLSDPGFVGSELLAATHEPGRTHFRRGG